jgi:two-component system chemotaxis response regulator CheY
MAKILIIDDSAVIRIRLKNIFERNGHTVVAEAENGLQGIQAYQEHQPDLVTMDINMPVMNGIEAVKKITQLDTKANVVVLSTEGHEAFIHDAIKNGAKYYLIKPFKAEHLSRITNRLLDEPSNNDIEESEKSEDTIKGVVLAIDTSEQVLTLTRDKLRDMGYAVLSENSLDKAYELAERGSPDLILIDVMQFGMNGFKVLNMLKKNITTSDIPVVMYSDNTEIESVLKVMQLGIADYISKKSSLNEFERKISANLKYCQIKKSILGYINNVYLTISQNNGISVISINKTIPKDEIVIELEQIFTYKLIEQISKTKIVLDVRSFSKIENDEKVLVHSIIKLLQNKEINIIAGCYYGKCCKDENFGDNLKFFISFGDLKSEAF